MADTKQENYVERLIGVRRVAKTTKGGRNMSFAALVVAGDGKGKVGVGYAKAREVPAASAKASQIAKSAMFDVPHIQGTIPYSVQGEDAAGVVFLRPASPGTGVIAGGPVRAVLECAGYTDVLTKSLGSSNSINIVHATIDALRKLETPETVAVRRGLPLEDIAPARLLKASAASKQADSEVESTPADKPAKDESKTSAAKTEPAKDEQLAKVAVDKEPAANKTTAKAAESKKEAIPAKKPAAKTAVKKAPAKKPAAKTTAAKKEATK